MSVRVSPTEKIRHEIDALFTEGIDLAKTLEQVARLGARLIIQTAVEAAVDEVPGRARHGAAARVAAAPACSRKRFWRASGSAHPFIGTRSLRKTIFQASQCRGIFQHAD